jgi:hypothetical protein
VQGPVVGGCVVDHQYLELIADLCASSSGDHAADRAFDQQRVIASADRNGHRRKLLLAAGRQKLAVK